MSIDNPKEPNDNDWITLRDSIRNINKEAVGVIVTDTQPTAATVPPGKMVVYDNGSANRRVYFRTGKDSVGYIEMTML